MLIEKITDAIGGIFKPTQIRRVARAHADAAVILAESEQIVSEIQRRAVDRLLHEESLKQGNIERISANAIGGLSAEARPQDLDNDWLSHFFDRCRLVSDRQMQELWGRLLAEQANTPGRFSKRTVDLLHTMDASDAKSFEQLCRFRWLIGKDEIVPLVVDIEPDEQPSKIYKDAGVTFETLTHLDSIGLVTFGNIASFTLGFPSGHITTFHWADKTLVALELDPTQAEPNTCVLDLGRALFTRSGKEIASLVESEPVEGFGDYIVAHFQRAGFKAMVRKAVVVASGEPGSV